MNKSENATLDQLFRDLGLSACLLGYDYARLAVSYIVDHAPYKGITTIVYPHIAQVYQTTPERVEYAIRYAIETAWTRGNCNKINDVFGYTVEFEKGRPTNAEFICTCAKYLQQCS